MKNEEVKDIVPGIYNEIEKSFDLKTKESHIIKGKLKVLKNKKANYNDANEFAVEVGNILADTFQDKIKTEDLPDGKMYYNIAKRLIEPNMVKNHNLVSEYSKEVQSILNKKANISIKAQKADLNQDRIDKIVDKITKYDSYDDGKWLLNEPIINFSQAVVDETIRKNVESHAKTGLRPKIIRKEHGNCCDWCKEIVGTYSYPDIPEDIYKRHRYCRCTVDYYPGDGKKQDVWSKKWKNVNEDDKIKKRIELSNKTNFSINSKQFGKKSNKHMKDYGLDVSSKADRKKFVGIINDIVENHDSVIRNINWRGQTNAVIAYIKGKDVVLVDKNNEFITILKGGINNARIKNARKQ
ncbi:MAG: hypothetical protein E7K89_04250 [Anaerococcus vaginalis]|nr:hypothetical protein [Anaerococcus vaginalis]